VNEALLPIALDAAVPLWIEEVKRLPWCEVERCARATAQIVAEKGDIILYRSKKRGESAAAFNALAKGLACLALAPGGVKVFGRHWQGQWEGHGG
jgi:nickel-dependent lactate racemase